MNKQNQQRKKLFSNLRKLTVMLNWRVNLWLKDLIP